MFFNVSNHHHSNWSKQQFAEAMALGNGCLATIHFPNIPPTAEWEDVVELVHSTIPNTSEGDVFMIQGEISFVLAATAIVVAQGATCVVACSERKVVESVDDNGVATKTAVFEFVKFRKVFA